MKHYRDEWIEEWCQANGWSEPFAERNDHYWAFPPNGVMPEPISGKSLKVIKAQKGLTLQEKIWLGCAGMFSLLAVAFSWLFKCPMPIVLAFGFSAVTAVQLEVEL